MSTTEDEDRGEFVRNETAFRDHITADPTARYPPAADRYHLYIARPCPWAHGAVLVKTLLGLDDVISMDVLDPYRDQDGWQFSPERRHCTPDTVHGFDYLSEIYEKANPDVSGRVSVPVLWDRKHDTIVNNESIEIMRMLATAFTDYQNRAIDLYPTSLRDEIDQVVNEIYAPINNGVYRAGFATAQRAYDTAVIELFDALDTIDNRLSDQRFLVGEQLTIADLRLFPTLVRFDHVYHTHFKCNTKRIVDFDNLWPYTQDIYQLAGVADTVSMNHIKEHYYTTHTDINPTQIIAHGPDLDFTAPHNRDHLPGTPPEPLS